MILVAGFVSWDPNLILSAAFTPEHLGMDFFWRRFRTCWMQTCFCFNKMINGKMAPSKSHHQVFARTLTQDLKATDLRLSAQHTLAVLGHGRPCSQKHFTWGHPENCSKTSDLHLSLFVSLQKKKRCHSTVSYLDLPNDVNFLLFQKLLLFWGTWIFFCLRAFFGFGPFWGTWTSHNGADKNLKRRNFPSKKRNFPSKKRKHKSGWQAFPSSQNPKHETALFLEKSKKYTKQQKKVLFQLRAIISHNRKFQVCHLILLFHVVSTFLTKHCKSCHNALAVVSNMQRMPKISPLFPAAKAGQVQIHFADL